ncbi:DNA polymerase III subunit delta [Pasteurellaceae bacterium USgator11]|nr:DNA polymerase III subunit delta [Pasteurellaceae bacterium USgator41]TNG93903.1 DNA polymerase III subunit delta [Pasteurellaceae bacterium UScroc12]TNG96892.1 DNA polymerase III subunit delta [Pasteurellaceae bacterium UScroc31]TNH02137.1 DNA polymerase III subunit delta [Pasteurellaceae bacterium USgator11]
MKRVTAAQLATALQQQLACCYLLQGQDWLLLDESRQAIKAAAKTQQFDEVLPLAIDNATDWDALYQACQSRGLFSDKLLIILLLPDNISQALQKKLLHLISLLHSDILLLLQIPRFNLQIEKQTWFVALNEYAAQQATGAVLVNCQTPSLEQLPAWLQQRAKILELSIEQEALQLLCYSYESNLLALKQILNLLKLLYPDGKLSYLRVKACVEQSSLFTPYQWLDALLEGKTKRAVRILHSLQNEEVQPLILLRSAQKELTTILQLCANDSAVDSSQPLPTQQLRQQFDRLRIWQNRRILFTQAIRRMRYADLYRLLQKLAEIERQLKRDFDADVWPQLQDFSLLFCKH